MTYRIGELAKLAQDLGFEVIQLAEHRIDVLVSEGCILVFCSGDGVQDDFVGLAGMQWHSHGTVTFLTGDSTYIECDELDLLVGLITGELLVITEIVGGTVRERWLAHKNEPFDLKHIKLGEELLISTATATAVASRVKSENTSC